MSFDVTVCVLLRDGVVASLELLDLFYLDVLRLLWLTLEFLSGHLVAGEILFPVLVVSLSREEHFITGSHCLLLILCHF